MYNYIYRCYGFNITLQIIRFHIIVNISNKKSNDHFILFTTENCLLIINQDTTAYRSPGLVNKKQKN